MAAFNTVEEVDQFCSRLYSGDKAVTATYTQRGWSGLLEDIGARLALGVLLSTEQTTSVVFVCRMISECKVALEQSGEISSVVSSVLDILLRRYAQLSTVSASAMRRLVCALVKHGYRNHSELHDTPTHFVQLAKASLDTSSECFRVQFVAEVLADLVEEMGIYRTEQLVADTKVAEVFRDEHLHALMAMAAMGVKQLSVTHGEKALNACLLLLQRTLLFNLTCTPVEEEDNWMTRGYPAAWSATVTDLSLFTRLWTLLSPDTKSQVHRACVLEVLTVLVSLNPTLFPSAAARKAWVEAGLLQTHVAMERWVGRDSEEHVTLFARLLNHIKPNWSLDEMAATTVFPHWVDSCRQMTLQCFLHRQRFARPVLSLLSVWSRLSGSLAYSTVSATTALVTSAALTVVESYLQCITARSAWFATEVLQPITGGVTSESDYPLDDDKEGAVLELGLAMGVAANCHEDGWKAVASRVQDAFATLERWLSCGGTVADPAAAVEEVKMAEEVVWHLLLVTAGFDVESGVESGGTYAETCVFCGLLCARAIALHPSPLDRLPPSVQSHIAEATTDFLKRVRTALVLQPSRRGKAFLSAISERLQRAGVLEKEAALAVFLLDLTVHHVRCVLNSFAVSEKARLEALTFLNDLTSLSGSIQMLKETRAYRWLLDLRPESIPAPLHHTHRARCLYVRSVAQVRLLDVSSTPNAPLEDFLQPLASRLQVWRSAVEAAAAGVADPELDEGLLALLADCRGVLSSCVSRQHYGVLLELLEPYCTPIAEHALTEANVGTLLSIQALKLFAEVTLNRGQRVFFGANSVKGYHVVRFASTAVQRAARLVQQAIRSTTEEEAVEWGWKALRVVVTIGRNVLRGGYCNLGVFELYNDPALRILLSSVWGVVNSVTFAACVERRKPLLAIVEWSGELGGTFFHWFWASQSPEEVRRTLGTVEAIAFPAQQMDAAVQAVALETLERFVSGCIVKSTFTKEEKASCDAMKRVLCDADGNWLHRLTTCCVELAVSTDTPESRQLLSSLLAVEGDGIAEVANYFASRSRTSNGVTEVLGAFAETQARVFDFTAAVTGSLERLKRAVRELIACLKTHM